MSKKKAKKFPIKIKTLSNKPKEEESKASEPDLKVENQSCDEITSENSKPGITVITTEISTRPKIVGGIPPWDDDDDSQQDDKSKPPTITAEIPSELEKFDLSPRATGEIPPWDDEEESK